MLIYFSGSSLTTVVNIMYSHNPIGKVFSRVELEKVAALCVKHNIIILSDEVYDRLYYVPFTRIATLSPEVAALTLTVGSAGKNFYATGWRVGYLIGPEHLIKYVAAAHTRICYSSVAPLQAAAAVGFEKADEVGFWDQSRAEMRAKMDKFCEVFDELGIPVSSEFLRCGTPRYTKPSALLVLILPPKSILIQRGDILSLQTWLPSSFRKITFFLHMLQTVPAILNCPGSLFKRSVLPLSRRQSSIRTRMPISLRIICDLPCAKMMTFWRLQKSACVGLRSTSSVHNFRMQILSGSEG